MSVYPKNKEPTKNYTLVFTHRSTDSFIMNEIIANLQYVYRIVVVYKLGADNGIYITAAFSSFTINQVR